MTYQDFPKTKYLNEYACSPLILEDSIQSKTSMTTVGEN